MPQVWTQGSLPCKPHQHPVCLQEGQTSLERASQGSSGPALLPHPQAACCSCCAGATSRGGCATHHSQARHACSQSSPAGRSSAPGSLLRAGTGSRQDLPTPATFVPHRTTRPAVLLRKCSTPHQRLAGQALAALVKATAPGRADTARHTRRQQPAAPPACRAADPAAGARGSAPAGSAAQRGAARRGAVCACGALSAAPAAAGRLQRVRAARWPRGGRVGRGRPRGAPVACGGASGRGGCPANVILGTTRP